MPQRSRKPATPAGKPRHAAVDEPASVRPVSSLPSLPPAATAASRPPSEALLSPADVRQGRRKPNWQIPEKSVIKKKAMRIVALRANGISDDDIAKELGIARSSIGPYLYRAGKSGWLDLETPADRLEYETMHKVVKNINESLNDDTRNEKTGVKVKHEMAMRMAESTVFKKWGNEQARPGTGLPTMALSIRIENNGQEVTMRAGTTGGTPAYVEGETVPTPE